MERWTGGISQCLPQLGALKGWLGAAAGGIALWWAGFNLWHSQPKEISVAGWQEAHLGLRLTGVSDFSCGSLHWKELMQGRKIWLICSY